MIQVIDLVLMPDAALKLAAALYDVGDQQRESAKQYAAKHTQPEAVTAIIGSFRGNP